MLLFLPSQGGEEGSIADMLRATAEQAMTQTGFVFDETTGMYYDHSTKFYYDSVGYTISYLSKRVHCSTNSYKIHVQINLVIKSDLYFC